MYTLLIVAPAAALTASLRFVLEAEDYRVTVVASLPDASKATGHFDCTVLDHHVLPSMDDQEALAFVTSHRPVVLLANDREHPVSRWCFRTLTKPLLGQALSRAVREAVEASAP